MKKEKDLPRDFVTKCKAITAKRARTVINHVLKNGFITSQELKATYGYNHPPRAIRDVKENGIPMEMFRTTGTEGVVSVPTASAIQLQPASVSSQAGRFWAKN